MSDISELLDYLRGKDAVGSPTNATKWATAVEQLQEDKAHFEKVYIRYKDTCRAYERILDKGTGVVSLGIEPIAKAYVEAVMTGMEPERVELLQGLRAVNVYCNDKVEKPKHKCPHCDYENNPTLVLTHMIKKHPNRGQSEDTES